MKKKPVKFIALLIVICPVLTLLACGNSTSAPVSEVAGAAAEPAVEVLDGPGEEKELPVFAGSGTEDDPWLIGAEEEGSVTAFLSEDGVTLFVEGEGRMTDFDDPDSRPWAAQVKALEGISIFGQLAYVGRNAFRDAGTETAGWFDVYTDAVGEYGDGAFENANFDISTVFNLDESCTRVGSRAFANCGCKDFYIAGKPDIAEDAFAGVTAEVCLVNREMWSEADRVSFGGDLTYKDIYYFTYEEDYGTDEFTGGGQMYIPEGEPFEYDAEAYCYEEGYHFIRYEVPEGGLVIDDPEDPVLVCTVNEDVRVRIVYGKD